MPNHRKRPGASIVEQLDDIYVYEVARRWLRGKDKVVNIARWLVKHHGDHLPWLKPGEADEPIRKAAIQSTRVKIYEILRIAAQRGFLRARPPRAVDIAHKVRLRFRIDERHRHVTVVNTTEQVAPSAVASAGAEMALKLIRRLGRVKDRVHIALGAGYTGMEVARRLGQLVAAEPDCPKLALHALTSGFSVDNPLTAPVTFFRFFDGSKVDIEFVGLFAAAFEEYDDYVHLKGRRWIVDSFDRAKEVDIVITSLATSDHEHGMLNQFLAADDSKTVNQLRDKGWVGDVQFLPYSDTGPIVLKRGIRAVTLFEFAELVAMTAAPAVEKKAGAETKGGAARSENKGLPSASKGDAGNEGPQSRKHVILVCGPCNLCRALKTKALAPLMNQPALRMWSHLVTDVRTAEAALKLPLNS